MRSSLTYWVRVKERMGIGGGRNNLVNSGYSSILGGHDNRVSGGNGVIAGGYNNVVTGANSAILGGSGNNDNGLAYVGIFGQNINNPLNMSANTFHVECLNAINTPAVPNLAHPSGTIVKWDPALGPVPANYLALYIAP